MNSKDIVTVQREIQNHVHRKSEDLIDWARIVVHEREVGHLDLSALQFNHIGIYEILIAHVVNFDVVPVIFFEISYNVGLTVSK